MPVEGFLKDEYFSFSSGEVRIYLTCTLRSFSSLRLATDRLVESRGWARRDAYRYLIRLRQTVPGRP